MNEDKLQKIKELGGMPGPSLAITKEGIPFEDFGDITLVGNKKLITSEKAGTYGADIYSPRVPKPEFILKDEQGLQKIADEIGVEFVDKISTPDGLEAFGKYKDKMITFAKNPIDSTPEHEVLHAYFDTVVKPNKKKEILDQIKKEKGFKNDLDAEEFLADNFVKYIQSREVKGISEKVKQFIKDLAIGFKEIFFENPDKVNELYRDLERLAKGDKRNLGKVALVGATQNKINQEDLEK